MKTGGFMRSLRRHLVAGLIVIAPVVVTGYVLWWLFQWLDSLLGQILSPVFPDAWVNIPGLGLLLLVLLLIFVGWATERAIGLRILSWWNYLLARIPLTRRLYSASNRIVSTVFGRDRHFLQEVVLVEWPSSGRYSIGFLTARSPLAVQEHVADGVTVFIPTAPNPASGFLVIIPSTKVEELPLTTEEAFTYLLSIGSVTPEVRPTSDTADVA